MFFFSRFPHHSLWKIVELFHTNPHPRGFTAQIYENI